MSKKDFSGLKQKKWTPHIFYIILHIQIRGHSKSTFVEEGRDHWKANKNEQDEVEVLAYVYVHFKKKKCWDFQNKVL